MKIAINGVGIAGPTLAYWLHQYGYEPVLFDKAPHLRSGGYMIDFWGLGYTVAERMGILPMITEAGYQVQALQFVDADKLYPCTNCGMAKGATLVKKTSENNGHIPGGPTISVSFGFIFVSV